MTRGTLLEQLTWVEAEQVLSPDAVVVIPLGAACKEHGPHLKLRNDFQMAEYLKNQVLEQEDVVIAPSIAYSYYPAFVDYPGSISLELDTAADIIIQVCMSLAKFGPRRFYVINTGVSTIKALEIAQASLSKSGFLLHFTDLEKAIGPVVRQISEQEGGSHADEIETSMMLVIDPDSVNMEKAVKDFDKFGKGRLTRDRKQGFTYSPTGIWGDASLATTEKGQAVVKSLVAGVIQDIQHLRRTAAPSPSHQQDLD